MTTPAPPNHIFPVNCAVTPGTHALACRTLAPLAWAVAPPGEIAVTTHVAAGTPVLPGSIIYAVVACTAPHK